jgi:hypothetical protein
VESVKNAQLLMNDDSLVRAEVREDGLRMPLDEQEALIRPPRRRVIQGGSANDDDRPRKAGRGITITCGPNLVRRGAKSQANETKMETVSK